MSFVGTLPLSRSDLTLPSFRSSRSYEHWNDAYWQEYVATSRRIIWYSYKCTARLWGSQTLWKIDATLMAKTTRWEPLLASAVSSHRNEAIIHILVSFQSYCVYLFLLGDKIRTCIMMKAAQESNQRVQSWSFWRFPAPTKNYCWLRIEPSTRAGNWCNQHQSSHQIDHASRYICNIYDVIMCIWKGTRN